jgi:hypothetical protein
MRYKGVLPIPTSIKSKPISFYVSPLKRMAVAKSFSTTSIALRKPIRPEPPGEVVAYFPQKKERKYIKEHRLGFVSRWERYIRDLGKSAAPTRLGGRDFGTRVRGRTLAETKKYRVKSVKSNKTPSREK